MTACVRASLLALLAAVAAPPARADDVLPPPQYSIKQSVPDTGTRIPRKIVQGSAIPLNRTYAQLTEEEQQLVKSQYEAMRPLDEPPFPAAGLRPIHEAIAEMQRRLLLQGTLSMYADVDAQGVVTGVGVYQSPDPQLTQAAAAVLMLTKFKPAVCRGEPCKMSFPLRVTFHVEH
ncbi:MAG: energy transducer TonB [Burkholderiales bacterium]